MATNYDINYNDKRFTEVEADKKAALNEVDVTYGNMISQSDAYFKKQMDAADAYAKEQKAIQQAQTDFAIEQINQKKEQKKSDYLKEQSGAYVDWQKQSNEYGANAEKEAALGMANTGYSESSQVSMYNTYQNRVATARETFNRAILEYDNAIKDAQLQNSSALAEIAYNALQTKLELSLEGFQYKNNLIKEKADQKRAVDNTYYARYQDVLKQINTENAMAEEVRQYNQTLAEEQRQFNVAQAAKTAEIKKPTGGGGSYTYKPKTVKESASGKKYTTNGVKNTKTPTPTKKTSSEPTVDMNSVLALGYGPISASTLNGYVERGLVIEYESDGKLKYKRAPYVNKQRGLLK